MEEGAPFGSLNVAFIFADENCGPTGPRCGMRGMVGSFLGTNTSIYVQVLNSTAVEMAEP